MGEGQGRCEDLADAAPRNPPAYGDRNDHTVHRGTGEIRLGAGVRRLQAGRPGVPGSGEPISGGPGKWCRAERKSEEAVVAMIGADNITRRSEGPLVRCATATAKTFGSRSFAGRWGR
jgi:hypothetical protein